MTDLRPAISCALVVALLLSQPALAVGEGWAASMDAASITTQGPATLHAALAALTVDDPLSEPLPDPAFHLHAAAVVVETQEQDPTLHLPVGFVQLNPQGSHRFFKDASVTGVRVQPGYALEVFPVEGSPPPRLSAATSCSSFTSYAQESHEARRQVNVNRHVVADTRNAVLWRECAGVPVEVSGTFGLILWGWDARVAAGDETVTLESGHHQSAATAGVPADASDVVTRDSQQYLWVQEGTVTLPAGVFVGRPAKVLALVRDVATDLHGAAGFRNVVGVMVASKSHPDNVDAHLLEVRGEMLFAMTATGTDRLHAEVTGTMDGIAADGLEMPLASTAARPAGPASGWLVLLAGAVLLPAGAMGATRVRSARLRRRHLHDRVAQAKSRWLVGEAFGLIEDGRHGKATRLTTQALRLDPQHEEAWHLRGVCLAKSGDLHDALEAHERAHSQLQARNWDDAEGPLRAENALQATRVCLRLAAQGEGAVRQAWEVRARQWLRRAVEADGSFWPKALSDPDVGPLAKELKAAGALGTASQAWVVP
ncbi:MAG TPA: bacterial transcriptional activator domain-containing protein [Candidatus Thermoplasmatota archaeon]|nr:bacterial transcriptional activator domain-containing protein [Candidatus Thermoplasmatota archaeon]